MTEVPPLETENNMATILTVIHLLSTLELT
jgi:hypothetical protein